MRFVRLVLLSTVVLALAQPVFACKVCDYTYVPEGDCVFIPGLAGYTCFHGEGGCEETLVWCYRALPASIASTYTVASVEVTHSSPAPATPQTEKPVVASNDVQPATQSVR
jgi:hypothetical protein